MVFFQHLDVGVVGQARLADGWKVGGFPAGAVEVLFDLGGHDDDGAEMWSKKEVSGSGAAEWQVAVIVCVVLKLISRARGTLKS